MKAIVESVAWDERKSKGVNISGAKTARPYFESAAVSLYSSWATNPSIERVLVTNTSVPSDVEAMLNSIDVKIIEQPFARFCFPFDLPWHLAYYKLCALSSIVNGGRYDSILFLDTDTWVRDDLDDLFGCVNRGGLLCMTFMLD